MIFWAVFLAYAFEGAELFLGKAGHGADIQHVHEIRVSATLAPMPSI